MPDPTTFTVVDMVNEQTTLAGLQELYEQGRLEEVLAAVNEHRGTDEAGETVASWEVQETILDIGVAAAHGLGRWPEALELSAALQRSQSDRGAGEEERTVTAFNDYGPLLRLGRGNEARELLYHCRAVFARTENLTMMGNTLTALADAEAHLGGVDAAVQEETDALRLKYRGRDPEAIAVSHYNLANYLLKAERELRPVWAHRLAAALIRYQIDSPRLTASVQAVGRLLGQRGAPSAPLSFDDVCGTVDLLPGVGFTELFDRLPARAATGQSALDEIMRAIGEARDTALHESVALWEPIISALVAAHGPEPDPEAAAVLGDTLAELRQQYAWRELVPVLTRIQAGPYYHSDQTIGFLDPISAMVAERAKAALAGTVAVDPTAWRALTEEV